VRERGGSLLMIAGPRFSPNTYRDSPLAAVLPVRLGQGYEPLVHNTVPVPTVEGQRSASTTLTNPESLNAQLWERVQPIHSVPDLEGAKPAANVLLTLSDEDRRDEPYPLIAWQRFGSGKSMYVGTDQLWRLRFKTGDRYHARFWGQTIQFLALSRLLQGSQRITLETDSIAYDVGDRVKIFANVLNDAYMPVEREQYTITVNRDDPGAPPRDVTLEPVPDVPGLYSGSYVTDAAGGYTLQAANADQDIANAPEFDVRQTALEMRQTAMQQQLLEQMAEATGGRYYPIGELPQLPDAIPAEPRTRLVRMEKELFDLPVLFVLLVILAGAEWFIRRRSNLV